MQKFVESSISSQVQIVFILFAACAEHTTPRKGRTENIIHAIRDRIIAHSREKVTKKKSGYWEQCAHIGPTRQPTKRRVRLTRQTAQQPTVCRAKSIRGGDRELPLAPSFHPRLPPDYPLPPPRLPTLFCSLVSFFGMPLTFSLAPPPNKRAIPANASTPIHNHPLSRSLSSPL